MRRFFTRTAFRNRSKQVSEKEWGNGFRKGLQTRAKMTSYVQRVFRSVAPLKKNSLIKAKEEISVMSSCEPWCRSVYVSSNNTKTSRQNKHFSVFPMYCYVNKQRLHNIVISGA